MKRQFEYLIKKLNLKQHSEGGYFAEIFRSEEVLKSSILQKRYSGKRSIYTSIYYLLFGNQFSAFHRLRSDEIWHFYEGTRLLIHIIENKQKLVTIKLGRDVRKGDTFTAKIKSGYWFAAEVEDKKSFSLVGCTVSPGFEFEDFELGDRIKLIRNFPNHKEIIERLAKDMSSDNK